MTNKVSRNESIDLCKFVAMFVVTWEHFAQGFSHSVFPNFFGGHWYGIAFCMPLFMVCSGWFTNFQKIKETSLLTYVSTRFNRLVIPALSFYLIYCLALLAIPNPLHAITFFWYLTSLFVCQLIIAVVAKLVPNKASLFIILPLILLVPYTDFLKINFMLPFLLGGVFLRYIMEKEIPKLLMVCVIAIITGYLLVFWKVDYSVYKMPFNSASFDFMNLGILAYRFSLGFWGSWLFIIIAKFLTKFKFFARLAKLGRYTLVMYTVSVVLKYIIQNRIDYIVDAPITLEIVSLIATLLLIILSVGLTKLLGKNKYTSFLFLGQKY